MISQPDTQEYIHELEAGQLRRQVLFALLKNGPDETRRQIVGDDPYNINDRNYGNNIVDDSKYGGHGTHCSGIIAAIRNNAIGMDGIADNVLIMPLRIGYTGMASDERDKDVALAIRTREQQELYNSIDDFLRNLHNI